MRMGPELVGNFFPTNSGIRPDGGTPSTIECLRVLNARKEAQDGVLKA
jgi:hypothetical protein